MDECKHEKATLKLTGDIFVYGEYNLMGFSGMLILRCNTCGTETAQRIVGPR